jgi:hypothetical protein
MALRSSSRSVVLSIGDLINRRDLSAAFQPIGYVSFKTMRTVLFLIAGKLDFSAFNPHTS